jgi:hypothetical protein
MMMMMKFVIFVCCVVFWPGLQELGLLTTMMTCCVFLAV